MREREREREKKREGRVSKDDEQRERESERESVKADKAKNWPNHGCHLMTDVTFGQEGKIKWKKR